jgi:hypothetical protein
MIDLKACPFCGAPAIFHGFADQVTHQIKAWQVKCDGQACDVSPGTKVYERKEHAADIWNSRAGARSMRLPELVR